MKPNRIPIRTRIELAQRGYTADPAYIPALLSTMANLPVIDYLGAFERERRELCSILCLTSEERQTMTYKEAAERIYYLRREPACAALMDRAVRLLAAPLQKQYEAWRERHEKTSA